MGQPATDGVIDEVNAAADELNDLTNEKKAAIFEQNQAATKTFLQLFPRYTHLSTSLRSSFAEMAGIYSNTIDHTDDERDRALNTIVEMLYPETDPVYFRP